MTDRTYRIQVASEMSGVSEGLIRAWERRYGVLKPRRTPSGYRAYTEGDIEILKRLKKVTEEGVAIAEAVKLLPQIRREVKEAFEGEPAPLRRVPQPEQFELWKAQVLEAAQRLDQTEVERVLDEAAASMPPVTFFDSLLAPLMREVGERWHQGTLTLPEEHLVSHSAKLRLLALLQLAPRRARHHVVCACMPNDEHELGLLGTALRFRHAGWKVTFLGARTPIEHLVRVIAAVLPEVVALAATHDPGVREFREALEQLVAALPKGTRLLVGGYASEKHEALVLQAGAEPSPSAEGWQRLLG